MRDIDVKYFLSLLYFLVLMCLNGEYCIALKNVISDDLFYEYDILYYQNAMFLFLNFYCFFYFIIIYFKINKASTKEKIKYNCTNYYISWHRDFNRYTHYIRLRFMHLGAPLFLICLFVKLGYFDIYYSENTIPVLISFTEDICYLVFVLTFIQILSIIYISPTRRRAQKL